MTDPDEELNQKMELMGYALKVVELIYAGELKKARVIADQVNDLIGDMWCDRCKAYTWGAVLESWHGRPFEDGPRQLCESCHAIERDADETAKAESLDRIIKGEE